MVQGRSPTGPAAGGPPTPPGGDDVPYIPRSEGREESGRRLALAFGAFGAAGLVSSPLSAWLGELAGLHGAGLSERLAFLSLMALIGFAVVAIAFRIRTFGLLLLGLVTTNVAAYVAFGLLALAGLLVNGF